MLEAAESLIREQGAEQVSLRGIARAAGVSHAAPYHHFSDLEDLLAAVAAGGFARLTRLMLEREAEITDDRLARLREAGIAYVGFAAEHPELYRLMFSGRLKGSRIHPELERESDATYDTLGALLAEALDPETADATGTGPNEVARASWALVHGLAMLLIDGRLDVDLQSDSDVREVAGETISVLGNGLGNIG